MIVAEASLKYARIGCICVSILGIAIRSMVLGRDFDRSTSLRFTGSIDTKLKWFEYGLRARADGASVFFGFCGRIGLSR